MKRFLPFWMTCQLIFFLPAAFAGDDLPKASKDCEKHVDPLSVPHGALSKNEIPESLKIKMSPRLQSGILSGNGGTRRSVELLVEMNSDDELAGAREALALLNLSIFAVEKNLPLKFAVIRADAPDDQTLLKAIAVDAVNRAWMSESQEEESFVIYSKLSPAARRVIFPSSASPNEIPNQVQYTIRLISSDWLPDAWEQMAVQFNRYQQRSLALQAQEAARTKSLSLSIQVETWLGGLMVLAARIDGVAFIDVATP